MSGGQLVLMLAGMHLFGMCCAAVLIYCALHTAAPRPPRRERGSDGGWGGGPPDPRPWPPRGGLPLPDAQPARVRLRDHRRLAELLPRRERRRAHEPERRPVPAG